MMSDIISEQKTHLADCSFILEPFGPAAFLMAGLSITPAGDPEMFWCLLAVWEAASVANAANAVGSDAA